MERPQNYKDQYVTIKYLLLITGAGASYDVVDRSLMPTETEFRPPLTKNLFYPSPKYIEDFKLEKRLESNYVNTCLESHPIASKIGLDYKMHVKKGKEAEGLENFLQNLKNDRQRRNQFWSVPIYLYDLFAKISESYIPSITKQPISTNYQLLIEAINDSSYNQLIWLNLNYDLFADFALKMSVTRKLNNLEDYLKLQTPSHGLEGLKIMYTKPHGSVNWFKKIDYSGLDRKISVNEISRDYKKVPSNFENRLSSELFIFTKEEKNNAEKSDPDLRLYPAITAPIGKYEFVCAQHKIKIAEALRNTFSVLCIGFSALDIDILNLINDNIIRIDRLKIVNGSIINPAGSEAYDRLKGYCKEKLNTTKQDSVFNGGFSDFIKNGIKGWFGA